MSILRLDRVRREVGTFVILDDITAAVAVDDRIGLVGPNGAGKTTLLRLAAGRDEPDSGAVHRKRGLTIGLLAQESHFDEAFMAAPDLRAAVRHGAAHLEAMAARLAALEHGGQVQDPAYADLQHQFEILGGYTLDLRVDEALSGLGFSRDEWASPPTALSGGEQTRATLARLVIAQPDLLLLDEPTNHLDIGAIEWLEEHLRRRHGALLVASHDRAFLDATVSRVWELRGRRLTVFRGDYSGYHRQREERDLRAVKDSDTQADSIEREKELVQRYRSHRKFSKMHEHEARLEKLQAEQVEAPRATKKLRLPAGGLADSGPSRSGEIVIRVEGLDIGYLAGRGALEPDGRPASEPRQVATVPFLAAQRGDKIGIVGPNGAGKTTLLRTIAGDLPPLDGKLSFGHQVQPGYLAQLRGAAIPGATVLDALLDAIPVTPGEARAFLARFLFRGEDVFKEVRALSGGERSRLELALLGIMPSNLLLLDEPTNHLDIPAREAIESFMTESPATLLVVSHDRRLLETVCTSLWVVDDGLAVPFNGGWREWRTAVADGWTVHTAAEREARRLRGGEVAIRSSAAAAAASTAAGRRLSASQAGASGGPARPATATATRSASTRSPGRRDKLSKDAYRRQKLQVDPDLTRLGLRKTQPQLSMASPTIAANFVEMRRVASELADVEHALTATEDAWLVLEERAPMTIRIGLTGPIGCGKSTVAAWLAERGALVIDADAVARQVSAAGQPAHDAILNVFGDGVRVEGGTLDREALARLVFADPAALRRLEAIVHPYVRAQILEHLATAEGVSAVVIEAIKLVEEGLADLCDEVWLVTCEPSVQRDRVLARGMSPDDADRRIAAQAGLVERVRPRATRVIDTSGPLADARSRVAAAWDAATRGG